jgi:hypothetical protein
MNAREPVIIQRHQQEVAEAMSACECQHLSGLAAAEFRRVADGGAASASARGLTPDKLDELLTLGDQSPWVFHTNFLILPDSCSVRKLQ